MSLLSSTDPADLANAARCFSSCVPVGLQNSLRTYLLTQVATISTPPCVTPTAPTIRIVLIISDTILQVRWNQVGNSGSLITGYIVYWGTVSGVYTNNSGVLPAFPRAYNITGLNAGTTYFMVVQAVTDISGCVSANSNEGSATTSGTPPNNLLANLVHYWKFDALNAHPNPGIDDSVGTLNTDSTNAGADLSVNNGGIISKCIACNAVGTVNQLLGASPTPADIKALAAGDGSVTMSLWFWLDLAGAQTAGFPMTMSCWGAAAGEQYYLMFVNNGNSVPSWRMDNNAGASIDLTWGAAISRQAWHLAVMGYDGTAGKSFLSIDNGALIYSAAFTPRGTSNNGNLGFFNALTVNNEWAGRNDECGIWNPRALTQGNINSLWNGGAGLPLASFT